MWYRGIRFIKDFMCQYLNYIFIANQKGSLVFTDGTKSIQFSSTPEAIKRASWEYRVLPAVLVGKVTGGLKYVSFSKDLLSTAGEESTNQTYRDGGDFDVNLSLAVRATTIEERDNLTDITGIYLSHPDAKDYFLRQGLRLPEAPKLGAETEVKEPTIDYPIYDREMSIRIMSRWQEERDMEERLLSILVDLSTYYTYDPNTGRVSVITE
jgi:hypothetical protein